MAFNDKSPKRGNWVQRNALRFAAPLAATAFALTGCAPGASAEKPPATATAPADPSPSEGNPPSTPGETEAPKKVDVMAASYEEIKPLTNDELFGELPEDLQPDNLASLSLDEIRERLSAQIDPNQGGDKELAQAAIAEILEKDNAYIRLASAKVYEGDLSAAEAAGLAAWQGVHNLPATATPKKDISGQWRQTAIKYQCEHSAKRVAASPIGGALPDFPTASGTAYDKDSVKVVGREADGTLIIEVETRFIIKDDAQRVSIGEASPVIDVTHSINYLVEVDESTGKITWTTA